MKTSERLPFEDLDSEFEKWGLNKNDPDVLETWITSSGSLAGLAAYAEVLWPRFLEHQGCVIREGAFSEEGFTSWLKECKGDQTSVEAVMNHVHIRDLFAFTGDPEKDGSKPLIRYVGNLLKNVWAAKLAMDFPDRRIKVEFEDEELEDPVDYQIVVYTERQQS
jgi:hypothetical protein